ncbi:hypothetical protein I553_10417 [Mycobacterium xenopi 4042]|uniref:Uncharacterized protein n=1 Tax=Mycobacterium xenopi 4042 TaxID=1299334 RepID=X7ZKP5_MYCXE|nr:hypothetical protein I553_10417 [Mycobacterium xenopi 4042]
MVQYVRGNFFAGEDFADLADAQAEPRCGVRQGRQRIHGTTCQRPRWCSPSARPHCCCRPSSGLPGADLR